MLARAARDHAGQEQLLEHASVAVLLKLLADGVGEVRANVLAAIRELGRARAGAAALVAADSVTLLVGRSVDETLREIDAFKFTDESGRVCPSSWKKGGDTIDPHPERKLEFFNKKYKE